MSARKPPLTEWHHRVLHARHPATDGRFLLPALSSPIPRAHQGANGVSADAKRHQIHGWVPQPAHYGWPLTRQTDWFRATDYRGTEHQEGIPDYNGHVVMR